MPFEIDVLKWIQSFANPILDIVFEAITMLGEQGFLVAVIAFVYWNVNKEAGKKIAYSLFVTISLNGGIKGLFSRPRPFMVDSDIVTNRLETATGSSFPSGHTQSFTTAVFAFAGWLKTGWFYLLAAILAVAVGLSRLYLGVHFPTDVVVGLLLGTAVALLCGYLHDRIRSKTLLYTVSFLCLLPFLLGGQEEDFIKALGFFAGFIPGNFIEETWVKFDARERSWWEAILRWAIGLGLVVAIRAVGKMILGETLIGDFVRYFAVSLVAIGVYPWVFTRIHKKFSKSRA